MEKEEKEECGEAHLADPFRMLCEEELEGVQFLRDTFDVVQTVDTNDHLASGKSVLQLCNTFLDAVLLDVVDEGRRVDSDREGADMGETTLEFYAIRHRRQAKNACT